jgi:geranylgeranyl reductase family protein
VITIHVEPIVDADVIVVGAGPAGAATAAHLARRGVDVLLVDRARFPRDKVCGDFVGPVALAELESLGVEFSDSNLVNRARLHLDGRPLIERPFPAGHSFVPHGRVVPRLQLDAWIVEAAARAGARLVEDFHVAELTHTPDGAVEVRAMRDDRTLRARVVVGADGSNSTIARLLRGSSPPRADRIVAVRAYYSGVSGPADRADLYFSSESFPGYYWLFPTGPDTANVGVGMVLETVPGTRDHLRDLLARLIERDEALRERLGGATPEGKVVGWPLTTYNPGLPLVGDRVVLVGDAGGLINSLNGEGIQYALLSARWAAHAIEAALERGDVSRGALATYADRIERELRYDLGVSRLVVRLISYRALNPVWLLALQVIAARARADPAYAETAGGVLAGVVSAQAVLDPRFVARTVGQAARTAGAEPAYGILRRPQTAAEIGIEVARAAFDLLYDAAWERRGMARWATSSATTAAGLAGRASLDAFRLRGRGRP